MVSTGTLCPVTANVTVITPTLTSSCWQINEVQGTKTCSQLVNVRTANQTCPTNQYTTEEICKQNLQVDDSSIIWIIVLIIVGISFIGVVGYLIYKFTRR